MKEAPVSHSPESTEMLRAYQGSEVTKKREAQLKRGEVFKAIFGDIDNTLYRGDRHYSAWELYEDAQKMSVPIISVTGNDYHSVQKRIDSGQLPPYDIIAGEVGTDIWVLHKDSNGNIFYTQDQNYQNHLVNIGFDRQTIALQFSNIIESYRRYNPNFMLDYQDAVKENELAYLKGQTVLVQKFKLSGYYVAKSEEESKQLTKFVSDKIPNIKVVTCEEIGYNEENPNSLLKKYCIDLLPITKAGAVNYLCDLLRVEAGVVAGDSGNDSDMLINSRPFLHSIAVGKRKSELTEAINNVIQKEQPPNKRFAWIVNDRGEHKRVYFINPKKDSTEWGPDSIRVATNLLLIAERKGRGTRRIYATE